MPTIVTPVNVATKDLYYIVVALFSLMTIFSLKIFSLRTKKLTPVYEPVAFSKAVIDHLNSILPDFNRKLSPKGIYLNLLQSYFYNFSEDHL